MNPRAGWHCKDLGDAMMAHVALAEIVTAAQELASREPGTRDLAVFMRHASEGRLHCAVIVYFPPAAATLAARFGAMPCRRPSRDGLAMHTGDESAWALLGHVPDRS